MGAGSSTAAGAAYMLKDGGQESLDPKYMMLRDCPLGKFLSQSHLQLFSTYFTVLKLAPHTRVTSSSGDFFVVGEGEIEVCTATAGVDKITDDQKKTLCTKRKGDFIYVPSVQRLVTQMSLGSYDMDEKPALPDSDDSDQDGEADQEPGSGTPPSDSPTAGSPSTTATLGSPRGRPSTVRLKGRAQINPNKKHKDLYNVLDTTSFDSTFGATLLKLEMKSYMAFRREITALKNQGDMTAESMVDVEKLDVVMRSNIIDYLQRVPFLKEVPANKLIVLGEMATYELKRQGQVICTEGEEGQEIFIVLDGKARVVTLDQNRWDESGKYMTTELAELGPGDYFGELAALVQSRRMATVIAEVDSLLVSFKRWNFKSFLNLMPPVRDNVMHLLKKHIIGKYVKTGNPLFSAVVQDEVSSAVADLCELINTPKDATILTEGSPASFFYFVVEGDVQLTNSKGNENLLRAGSHFGDQALILEALEMFTAVSKTNCTFLKFSDAGFKQYLSLQPHVHAALEIRARAGATPLERFLQYPPARDAFKQHLYQEFSAENLNFYEAVMAFEKMVVPEDMDYEEYQAMQIREIYTQFVDAASTTPINISNQVRQAITLDVQQGRFRPDIFDKARNDIMALMTRDMYPRFKQTDFYRSLLMSLRVLDSGDGFFEEGGF